MANPHNIRQAMNRMDPRQRGLFAAAWSVGFVAQFAKCGASAITLGETVGELGIVYGKTDYSQPWFDEHGGVYPVYHTVKGLAALRGRPLIDLVISKPREIQAIAAARDGGVEIWVANLTDQTKSVEIAPASAGVLSVLSAAEFARAARDVSTMDSLERGFNNGALILPPYAVARFRSLHHS